MPTARWTERERRTGLILQAVLGLNDQEVFDLMGRIFGEDWRAQVSRNERKKYLLKDIRDEIKWRWSAGKRQAQWNTIDPEGGPSPAERNNWMQTLAEIRTAAADTTLPNFLLEDGNGNLTRPLAVIPIPAALPAYQRDPNTFDAVFESRRRPAGRAAGASTQASSSRTTTLPTRTSPPATRTRTLPTRASTLPTRPRTQIKSPAKTKSAAKTKSPAKTKSTTTAGPTTTDDSGWFLPMIHRNWLVDEQADQLQVHPQWLQADGRAKHIYEESPVRVFAGQVIRLHNPIKKERFDDFLVCQDQVCSWCTGTAVMDDACDAELVTGVDVAQSPTQGQPFVHMGRDVSTNALRGSGARFNPAPGFHEMRVPSRTSQAKIDCMTEGNFKNRAWRAVNVLGCVEARCDVCTSAVDVETAVTEVPEGTPAASDDNGPEEENEWGSATDSEESKGSDYGGSPSKRPRRGNGPKKGRRGGRGGYGGRGGRGGRAGRAGKGGGAARGTTRKAGTVVAGSD